MWERALRRTALPVAYTGGFTPRPKVSFGLALPTGHESLAEYLDVEFATAALDVAALPAWLSAALPVGIDVLAGAVIDDNAESLQEEVTSTEWELDVTGAPADDVAAAVERALAAPAVVITRERKGTSVTEDVRPAILSVAVSGARVRCELATRPRGLRPAELVSALDSVRPLGFELGYARRLHQWIARDGARWEPLPPPDAPRAEERAS
jgi:radical SAM-linked protein